MATHVAFDRTDALGCRVFARAMPLTACGSASASHRHAGVPGPTIDVTQVVHLPCGVELVILSSHSRDVAQFLFAVEHTRAATDPIAVTFLLFVRSVRWFVV